MKIISGGQTGSDLGGLEGAKKAKLETGGMAPHGYRTENGPNLELHTVYGLKESDRSNYNYRTQQNIKNSDGTVIFAKNVASPGTHLTITICRGEKKPYICNPSVNELQGFCNYHNVQVLNVAGNRESVAPGIQKKACEIIWKAFK